MSLKQQLVDDMKAAMRAGDKQVLGTIRLINAAIKQKEIDGRSTGVAELDDNAVIALLDKMVKQRRDSISQYEAAKREDLVAIERNEIEVIARYLPQKMDETQIQTIITAAIAQTGAASMADMGKLMAVLKPQLTGKADMAWVSKQVRQALAAP